MNGEFGGSVGISSFDLAQNREVTLVEKKTVAAVPCPPAGSEKSRLEAFMGSQVKNHSESFPQLKISHLSGRK